MRRPTYPSITSLEGPVHAPRRIIPAAPEAQIARALVELQGFDGWTHQPLPPELETVLADLQEQHLMTAAAVCLLRLAKLQNSDDENTADAA